MNERLYSWEMAQSMTSSDAMLEIAKALRLYAQLFGDLIRDGNMTEFYAQRRYTALRVAFDMLYGRQQADEEETNAL